MTAYSQFTPTVCVISLSDFAISQKDVEFIDKINAILSEQVINENYSIDILADQMNMSHSNLYRKMKGLFGMPPNNYVKNFRLNKAAELIANGVRIAEAAERLGFASSSHFAKCFKHHHFFFVAIAVQEKSKWHCSSVFFFNGITSQGRS